MIKKLSTLTKGYLITIFVSLFLSLLVVYFFLIRVKQIDSYCFAKIQQDIKTQGWPDLSSIPQDTARNLYEAQLYYIITQHRLCVENQKFFYFY